MTLRRMKEEIDALPDDVAIAVHHARYLEQEAQRVSDDALISGAMPGDFTVVHVYLRLPLGTRLE